MPMNPAQPDDLPAIARIVALAFGSDVPGALKWLQGAGVEHLRILRDQNADSRAPITATCLRIAMGHFFGGRSVPCIGIAGVAVPPEHRGGGVASRLMREAIREIHDEGVPLSSLYAATQPLYRRVGFEQAWHRIEWTIPLDRVSIDPATPRIHQADPADETVRAALRAVYTDYAATQSAMLDRRPYIWNRVLSPRDAAASVLLIGDEAASPEGYLVLSQQRDTRTGRYDVVLHDAAATTPRAWARALGALGRFRTQGNTARFFAGAWHPWFALDTEQTATPSLAEAGMLRIVRVAEAIEARAYSPGVTAAVDLEIADDTLPDNSGRWTLHAEAGQGRAARGGSGAVRLSINALAGLYSGFVSGRQAAQFGWAAGPAEALDTLTSIFAGPTPWLPDNF